MHTRHQTKFYEQQAKTISLGSIAFYCRFRPCAGQRSFGHQPSHEHGDLVLRSRHETHLCHRCRGGAYRGNEGVFEVLVRRPGHLEDRCLLVRCLHLPHRGGHHPAFLLPLNDERNRNDGSILKWKGVL